MKIRLFEFYNCSSKFTFCYQVTIIYPGENITAFCYQVTTIYPGENITAFCCQVTTIYPGENITAFCCQVTTIYPGENITAFCCQVTTIYPGENITEYLSSQCHGRLEGSSNNKYQLLHLQYVPEVQEVYCTTNRRTVMVGGCNIA